MPILIPAAGQSSRMRGADKLELPVGGVPLLRRQVEAALTVSTDVRVALPPAPHPRHGLVPAPARRIEVADAHQGLSASLRALIETVEQDVPRAMILLADLPELTAEDLQTVADGVRDTPDALVWRGSTEDGLPGHPLVIASALFPAFSGLSGDAGGQSVLKTYRDRTHLVPLAGQGARRDLDTPEAWAAWRAETGL